MSGLPDRMANGPSSSEDFEKDAQIWEKPWTLEQMRQTSSNWSLAADSGLFLFLQDFSHRMLSKTHEIEKQLDSLIRDTKATDSCLHSVFNDFLMLSNTQFIENRVYDEEVEETITKADALEKQPEQEKTREQKEAELIPKMQEAVNYGLLVLESAFEHLDIKAGNSDSEDEEVTDRVEAILEPKDLYVDRPLPYLIGSQAFMEQDDVGLGDLSSDEMSVDRDSVIESEDDKEAVQSDDDFNQYMDEDHISNKKTSMLSSEDDGEEDQDSDIFGESDKDDDDEDVKNAVPSSFTDELAARIKGEPVNKPEGDRKALIAKKKSKGRKESKPPEPQAADNDSDDMFKPPKMDDDDFSPFGGKSGLFSGGKGLFDDDDEGDLFSDVSKPAVSQEKKALQENTKSTPHRAENNLFGSGNESDSLEKKENGTPGPITHSTSNPSLRGGSVGVAGGGLFDDEDDDFFSGQSLKRTSSEKPKTKKAIDLFDEDEEGGDIFSDKYSTSNQTKKEDTEVKAKPPEKKMPAGAVSLFGPGTKSLLTEGLKKHQLSTSEEPEKSEENGSAPASGKAVVKPTQKPQTRGLFSDDEDSEVFPARPQSPSKPKPSSEAKISKAPLSLFDDEEEEDLFGSAAKSKPNPTKASTPQPKKTAFSSLFSDDEDQGISSKGSAGKSEIITGGMKSSASAPSNLPSAKIPHKSSLFDDDEDDDLFAPTKETSQKPQRGALLFEDEDDEDKGSFFNVKPAVNTNTASPATKSVTMASQSPSEMFSEDQPSEQEKPAVKKDPFTSSPPPVNTESKKKPAGAVSLFGGIDVLVNKRAKSPSVEDDSDDVFLSQASPPPSNVKKQEETKEEKVKPNTVSLFDDDEKEDESEWNDPIFNSNKPMSTDTKKPAEARQQKKSTGVFQDEELLFSHTQQKDNDPDVDLFATSGKPTAKLGSVKAAAPSLFAEDEDDDDLFSFTKPKVLPPKVAEKPSKTTERTTVKVPSSESVPESLKPASSPVKAKETSSRIGKLQANLAINPSALLPGAVPSKPGGVGVLPGAAQSSSSGVSSSSSTPTTPVGLQTASEGGVSFDTPVQVTILQSTHKSRTKGSAHRRPQSRAARQQAAQRSVEDGEDRGDMPEQTSSLSDLNLPASGKSKYTRGSPIQPKSTVATTATSHSQPSLTEIPPRPSVLTLPGSTNSEKKDASKESTTTQVLLSPDGDNLFGSDSITGATSAQKTHTASNGSTAKTTQSSKGSMPKNNKDKTALSIFDDSSDDLFKKVKPRPSTKKADAPSFLEDDDDDIFGMSNSSTPTLSISKDIENSDSLSKQDIFKGEIAAVPKVHKTHKEKPVDSSVFDDNIDIFADLMDTVNPKQTSKRKGETKSIFDDDMDDIFSTSTVKSSVKAPPKSKKTPASQEPKSTGDFSDIFDDPLNALGGK